ncbi:MAG: tetratricopeptide repeat protein [Bacteroidia bacterium]
MQKLLPTITVDSIKVQTLNKLAAYIVDIDPHKSIKYAEEAYKIAMEIRHKKFMAIALHNIGNGQYNLAEYKKALSFYINALNIQEAIGNKKGILSSSGAIGNVLLDLKQYDEAQKYFNRTLKIAKELKNKAGIATALSAIGSIYSAKKDYKQSADYCTQALKLFEEIDYKDGAATCYNNLAEDCHKLGDVKKALNYINKAYFMYHATGNIYGMSLALNNTGSFYETEGNNGKALEFYKRGLEEAKKIGANDRILASYKGMADVNKKMNNFKDALYAHELFKQMNDSIFNLENSKQIAEMQTRFDTETKAKEISILTKDKKIREDELSRQRFISWSVTIGGFLILLLALVAIRGYAQKRKANNELAIKNKKIEQAYDIIEDQHKDIKSSIRYAKRIQEAILPTNAFSDVFKENAFVFYSPKDIVSGDFYWIEKVRSGSTEKILFAAVDCTGHGVPGAFMSIVGHNLLNQSVNEHHKIKPSDILDELNIGLSETLRQTAEDSLVKDGMDIALCSLEKKDAGYLLEFAGANNPVWIVKQGTVPELKEIKGDKHPIGIFLGEKLKKFSNHEVELMAGDTIYVFTDGYADQFGGPNGKKFKYKPMQELIISVQGKPMSEQMEILNITINRWRGNLEQVDDILVIGIRV